MTKMENIEKKLEEVNLLANEVAKKANETEFKYKQKISLMKILIICLTILGTIGMYLMYQSNKYTTDELIYTLQNMVVEEEYIEVDSGDGGNAIGILGDNNEVSN